MSSCSSCSGHAARSLRGHREEGRGRINNATFSLATRCLHGLSESRHHRLGSLLHWVCLPLRFHADIRLVVNTNLRLNATGIECGVPGCWGRCKHCSLGRAFPPSWFHKRPRSWQGRIRKHGAKAIAVNATTSTRGAHRKICVTARDKRRYTLQSPSGCQAGKTEGTLHKRGRP